jgi:hypothetical protein
MTYGVFFSSKLRAPMIFIIPSLHYAKVYHKRKYS